MHFSNFLALPPTILLLCAAPVASESQWPHNLPRHMKYFPEDEVHVKRSLSIQEKLQREKPIGVKKMSEDDGEMFFLDNWIFASDLDKRGEYANASIQAFSPLRPHSEQSLFEPLARFFPRAALFRRDFQCPTGTTNCSSISAPNSCCGTSDTCINIQDTGYGSVGCCPQGQSCAGTISCAAGYTSCPDTPNRGCCLPGFSCQDVGCVVAGTSTTTVEPGTSTSAYSSFASTAVVVVPTSQPPSSSSPPSTSSAPTPSSTSAYICSTGWYTCPSSLGGGCCQNGLQCASGALCYGSSTSGETATGTASAPSRPTGDYSTTSADSQTSGTTASLCPTGFYACSAYYPSGCCRIGKDCQTTGSCVPTASTSVVVSDGVTIVAPTGASFATTAAAQRGSCPNGWYSCAASVGGNCCMNGYACGEQCTATSGGQVAGKVAPSTATSVPNSLIWALISGVAAIGTAMLIL